jgi:hypothetical protein
VEANSKAYIDLPPTEEEARFGHVPVVFDLDDDDIDYDAIYGRF